MACCAFAIFLIAQLLYAARRIRAFLRGQPVEEDATTASGPVAWYPGLVAAKAVPSKRASRAKLMLAAAGGFILAAPAAASDGGTSQPALRTVAIGGFQIPICGT